VADRLHLKLPDWARGVLVVADLHGHPDLFQALIDLAEAESRFIVSLGDLVDRGSDNAATVRQMLRLLKARRGLFIRGNHDDKLFRTLKGNPTIVDSDLAVTIEQLDAAADGKALKKGFSEAYRHAPYLVRLGDTVLVHGGWAPAMLKTKSLPKKLAALALYGEATQDATRKKPVRTYRWLESVTAGMTVVIGHHPISDTTILARQNAAGGRLLHLDCGAGKGRGLGALRLSPKGAVEAACRASRREGAVIIEAIDLEPYSPVAETDDIG
jgi:predicted phosphodiesterase